MARRRIERFVDVQELLSRYQTRVGLMLANQWKLPKAVLATIEYTEPKKGAAGSAISATGVSADIVGGEEASRRPSGSTPASAPGGPGSR